MKQEKWNGHDIRFVEHNSEWWAVARDIANALEYAKPENAIDRHCKYVTLKRGILTKGGEQEMSIIPENDIYRLVFRSNKPEAEDFQDWVFSVIKELREQSGLKEFEVFQLLDKEVQKTAMSRLHTGLEQAKKTDYIKANTIADKATSNMFGYPKMLKKSDMSPEMLLHRQAILNDTIDLMAANDGFNLGLSVSNEVYKKYSPMNG